MIGSLARGSRRVLPFFMALTMGYMVTKTKKADCWWPFETANKRKTNKITGRINILQYQAYDPIEDTLAFQQLKAVDGYFAAIFDGHGGDTIAKYLKDNFGKDFEQALERNKATLADDKDKLISQSLIDSLTKQQAYLHSLLKSVHTMGFPSANKIGSCALIVVISDNKIYTATIGNSMAIVLEQKDVGEEKYQSFNYKRLNIQQSINDQLLKREYKKLFPKEDDIVICHRRTCYVKGILQPTRAIGCFALKDPVMKPEGLKNFTGPYIKSEPVITTHEITPNDRYVLLASDGLWKETEAGTVTSLFTNTSRDNIEQTGSNVIAQEDAIEHCLDFVLSNVRRDTRATDIEEVKSIPVGARSKLHDDITIMCINLENQL